MEPAELQGEIIENHRTTCYNVVMLQFLQMHDSRAIREGRG